MRILCYILVVLFVTTSAVGQQINPVPDYIFRNSMSVGRNAPTDTSAYFSIGPRFGATRGFMPPMVVDTAAVTGTKRNGLLIYSIQRNSFLYWDSTGMRWSRIAANLDTLLLSTRAWRQKGIDSLASVRIGGSGTLNYVPKFSASTTLANSQIFDNGTSVAIAPPTTTVSSAYRLGVQGAVAVTKNSSPSAFYYFADTLNSNVTPAFMQYNYTNGTLDLVAQAANTLTRFYTSGSERMRLTSAGRLLLGTQTEGNYILEVNGTASIGDGTQGLLLRSYGASSGYGGIYASTLTPSGSNFSFITSNTNTIISAPNGIIRFDNNGVERMRMHSNGRFSIGSTTDAGYQFDVAGSMRNTTDAYFATSSGTVGIGTTTPDGGFKLDVNGAIKSGTINASNSSTISSASPGAALTLNNAQTSSSATTVLTARNATSNQSAYALQVGTGLVRHISTWLASAVNMSQVFLTTNTSGAQPEMLRLTHDSLAGILTGSPTERLDVNGRIRARTIDSSSSPINMLWSTPTGVISKTAPPAFMVSSNATAATSWNFARDVTNSGNISRVTRTHDNAGDTTVTFHIAVYIATASFTTGSWVEVATLPTGYRPNEVVYGSLPDFVSGDVYEAQNGTDFAADAEYTGATVFRVLKDGKVQVRVATVTSSVTLSGTNNVLFPISFSFTIRPISV